MSGQITRRFTISGRVQGVGYRFFAQRAAHELGVRGWVRNLPDGRVESSGSGPAEALAAFEARLRAGPRFARVVSVDVHDAPGLEPPGFHIR